MLFSNLALLGASDDPDAQLELEDYPCEPYGGS